MNLKSALLIITGCAMASASASVDSKAELTALLEQWEREQQGSTQELVTILTKSVFVFPFLTSCFFLCVCV